MLWLVSLKSFYWKWEGEFFMSGTGLLGSLWRVQYFILMSHVQWEGNGEISMGSQRTVLSASYSLLMWCVFQERGQAQGLNTKIKMDFPPPSVHSEAQKSIVLWDNCEDEWSGLSGGDCGAGRYWIAVRGRIPFWFIRVCWYRRKCQGPVFHQGQMVSFLRPY